MTMREEKLVNLYEWAVKYARIKRSNLVEVHELANEMLLYLMQERWRSLEFAKCIMRRRASDYQRHLRVIRAYELPEMEDEVCISDDDMLEARDQVREILRRSRPKDRIIIRHLLQGSTIQETSYLASTPRRTIHRIIRRIRQVPV